MDILGEFTSLISRLEYAGIDYATCGGLALAVHGFVRATKDIDLLIRGEDLEKCFSIARGAGFDIEGLPLEFDDGAFQLRRLSKVEPETGSLLTIDFILVTEAIRDVWDDRVRVSWGTGEAWVVSREGLIKMKTTAGRDQDLVDIRRLEAVNDES